MPRSRRQKRLGQHQAVLTDRINKGKCEVWVGNLPRYGINTNNIGTIIRMVDKMVMNATLQTA